MIQEKWSFYSFFLINVVNDKGNKVTILVAGVNRRQFNAKVFTKAGCGSHTSI